MDQANNCIPLCQTTDFSPEEVREFTIEINNKITDIFVIHKHNQFHAYINQCPHTGVTLNWQPNQFFDIENKFIQCATHGALFRVNDGHCVRGPCVGKNLFALELMVKDHQLLLQIAPGL